MSIPGRRTILAALLIVLAVTVAGTWFLTQTRAPRISAEICKAAPALSTGMLYFDVPVRQDLLRQTSDPVLTALMAPRKISLSTTADQLESPIVGQITIPEFYKDYRTQERNPDWSRAMGPLLRFHEAVNDIGRLYVISGDPAYALLLTEYLDRWAAADSLTEAGNKQGFVEIIWAMLDMALAYSTVRNDPGLDATMRDRVDAWVNRVAHRNIEQGAQYHASTGDNNGNYDRAAGALLVSAMTGDAELEDWAVATYRRALTDMRTNGSLPRETDRRAGALKYTNFAQKALVLVAEIGDQMGLGLYDMEVDGKSIHTAADFALAASINPDLMKRWYDGEQDRHPTRLSWAEPYYRRFPKPEMARFVGGGELPSGVLVIAPLFTLYFYVPEVS